jgi:hypothetical protein
LEGEGAKGDNGELGLAEGERGVISDRGSAESKDEGTAFVIGEEGTVVEEEEDIVEGSARVKDEVDVEEDDDEAEEAEEDELVEALVVDVEEDDDEEEEEVLEVGLTGRGAARDPRFQQ